MVAVYPQKCVLIKTQTSKMKKQNQVEVVVKCEKEYLTYPFFFITNLYTKKSNKAAAVKKKVTEMFTVLCLINEKWS